MADPLFPNPSEAEGPASPAEWIVRQQRSAQGAALQGLDANPDDGARAIELGKATGAAPEVVYGDLDRFEQQHKAALTSQLLSNNQFLRDYANTQPMAGVVSADDWGQLDAVSQALMKYSPVQTVVSGAIKGFREGFGDEDILRAEPESQEVQDFRARHPLISSVLDSPAFRLAATEIGVGSELMSRTFAGGLGALHGALESAGLPKQLADDIAGMVEHEMIRGEVKPEFPEKALEQVRDLGAKIKPFVESGVEPPVGVHSLIDQAKTEQVKLDMRNLDDVLKEAQASSTRERAPELFESFIRQHTDSRIGISAEAVRKLYGDKVPEADDNLLGWVPGIQDQLALAEAHGGDVEVPLSAWLAKVDPEVAKELHDSIRVRPGGMTLEEAKEPVGTLTAKPIERSADVDQLYEAVKKIDTKNGEVAFHSDLKRELGLNTQELSTLLDKASRAPDAVTEDGRQLSILGSTSSKEKMERINVGQTTSTGIAFRSTRLSGPVDSLRAASGLAPETLPAEVARHPDGIIPRRISTTDIKVGDEVHQAVTFPASDAISEIDKSRLTGVGRALAEFFGDRLSRMAGDTTIHVVNSDTMDRLNAAHSNPPRTPAYYDYTTHSIVMREGWAIGRGGHDYAAKLITEEVAHAATAREMFANQGLRNKVRLLRDLADDWLTENDPEAREKHSYRFTNEYEFIAGAYSFEPEFQEVLSSIPLNARLSQSLGIGSGKTVWDAVRHIIKDLIEKLIGVRPSESIMDGLLRLGPEFEEMNKKVRAFEAGDEGALPAAPREPFDRPAALGMNKERAERYRKLIEKQQAEDAEFQRGQGLKEERERQTKEWKENYSRVREETAEDLKSSPDLAAERFLRTGELYGEKTRKVKLDKGALTDEQAKSLPPEFLGADGAHPDDIAGLFGYSSGDGLVAGLARLEAERQLEGLTPAAHFSKLVDAEADRAMRRQYGDLEQNIIEEAKEHVLSPTQMDILHEELQAWGIKAHGEGFNISKNDLKAWAKQEFDKQPVSAHSSSKYLAAMGRAANREAAALLENDAIGGYKAKQEQVLAGHLADLAKKLEKEQKRDETLRKKLSKAEPTGIDPEYAIWAQDIIARTGGFVRRSLQGTERQKQLLSGSKDLRAFVEGVNAKQGIWGDDPDSMSTGVQMPVADFLLDPSYRKSTDDMTTEEWRAVANSLKTIDKNGREVNKYTVKGNKEDLKEVIGGLIERLRAAVDGKKINLGPEQATSAGRIIGSLMLNVESWFSRLDLGNRQGPFQQLIVRPVMEGQYTGATMKREISKEYREIGDFPDVKKKIDNPLLRNPTDGSLLELTKENLYSIISNMGNELQRKKLAGGYGVKDPNQVLQWAFANSTKEDWQRAQRMGDFFERLFQKSEVMYSGLNGFIPDRIELGTIQTPWGPMKEWYHPLIPNPILHGADLKASDMVQESGYYRPAPASGYTKGRTGAIYPIDLTFRGIQGKVEQMINDIAMRPAITEVSKILLNKDFRNNFTQYYGKEYEKAIVPWLRDVAGQRRYVPSTDMAVEKMMTYVRENMATLLIGMNPGTVMKHAPTALGFSVREVGLARFADSLTHMIAHDTPEGQSRWRFAMENSEELQNRLRSSKESMLASDAEMFRKYDWDNKFFTARDAIQTLGSIPVAMSDFMSAVPMWDAAYRGFMEDHPDATHGDAVYAANTAVRRTHGSSLVANRPAIMRMNAFVQMLMPFYNFFNNALQRLHEFGWKSRLALEGRTLPEMTGFEKEEFERGVKHVPHILGGFLTFGVLVSLIENMVDPLPQNHDEGSMKHWAKVLARGPIAMIPGVREFVGSTIEGFEPSGGLIGTFYKDIAKPVATAGKVQDPSRRIRQVNDALGAATGLTYSEVGKVGQYMYNVSKGKERPKGFGDWYRGVRHGTQKEPKR